MKRLSLTIAASCFVLMAMAEPISKQAALYTAQAFMLAKGKTAVQTTPLFPSGSRSKASAYAPSGQTDAEQPYYYVFNSGNDGGYVIVSGDDRTEPILGYVEQGTFDPDNIPENMRSWLQSYADQIKYIVDNNIDPNSPLLKRRNKVRGTKHSVPELLTTRWNQGHPYNLTCPKYYKGDGNLDYPATGCTATAMAQVVNFYRFPARLKAQIPALTNSYTLDDGTQKTVTAPAIPRNSLIDWDNMRDTYNCWDGHVHNAQDTAVANLMLYCGQSVNMGYGASSGANFSAEAFTKYFGFDDSAFVGERYEYSIDQWFDMLYGEIAAGYPVLFSGFSSGGGHAFVLDGFDGENLFHLNWGWGGGSNGWFLVGILNPGDNSGIGASSSSDGYSMGQRALFGLRLPDNVRAEPTAALTVNDVEISGTSIKGNWINWTGNAGNFNTGIVKLNDDGTLSLVGAQQSISNMAVNTFQSKTFSILKKLPEGTYKLSPASKLSTGRTWRPKYNMRDEYIEAVVDAEGTPTLSFKTPVYNISIEKIEFPGTHVVGTEQEVKVTYRNNGDEYYREIHFFASKTNDKVYTESRSMVAVRKGETVEVSYFFKPDETGTYNLWFCTESNGNGQVGTGTMEIVEESQAVKANLAVTSFTVSNSSGELVYGRCFLGKVVIKNNAATNFSGQIRFQTWAYWDGDQLAYSGPSQTAFVNIEAGKTATVDFDVEDLNDIGRYYYLSVNYVGQDGSLANAGTWDHRWKMGQGILTWSKAGVVSAKDYTASVTVSSISTACGFYADCNNFTRLSPNTNKNTVYAFSSGMEIPSSLDNYNAVSGSHANHINLVNDKPVYFPLTFDADDATFTYTFPSTEDGTRWHTFTMPFKADSVFVDEVPVVIGDVENHFRIYEFAAQGNDGEVIFAPATELRAGTPYIIAGDAFMAGRSIVFRSHGVTFSKTGSDKMVVTSQDYKFQGTTLGPVVKGCYVLNAEGTAFNYVSANKTLNGMNAYFTTTLPEGQRLASIPLPELDMKEAIFLSEHSVKLLRGEELQLSVGFSHATLQGLTLQWTSSDETVATVDERGLVVAKRLGTADIIVSALEDETLSDTCTVNVIPVRTDYRYYQFAIEAIREGNVIQFSEFDLIDENGKEITPLTLYAYTGEGFDNEKHENLFDDDTATKFCSLFNAGTTLYIYVDAGKEVTLSGYRITTANDTQNYPGRNPASWKLLCSNTQSQQPDDNVWLLLDSRENDATIGAVNFTPFDFSVTYPQPTPIYSVTASATEGGSIALSETEVEEGSDVTVTITVNEDYTLLSLFVNGKEVTPEMEGNQYVIHNITDNIEVHAVFRATIACIELSDNGERTYCSDIDLDFSYSPELQAYIASGYYPQTGCVLLTRVLEVPAGTGIVLRGDKGTYRVRYGESTAYYLNLLVGNVEQTTVQPTEGNNVNLSLSSGDDGLCFYRISSPLVMEKNSARLQLPANIFPSSRRNVTIIYEEDADAIRSSLSGTTHGNAVYDLQGRQVGTDLNSMPRGLYIINGQKVVR